MLRTTFASSRMLRALALGLVTVTTTVIFTTDSADARRYRRHHVRHHEARTSYSPSFASIIVVETMANPPASGISPMAPRVLCSAPAGAGKSHMVPSVRTPSTSISRSLIFFALGFDMAAILT